MHSVYSTGSEKKSSSSKVKNFKKLTVVFVVSYHDILKKAAKAKLPEHTDVDEHNEFEDKFEKISAKTANKLKEPKKKDLKLTR
jgi:hypothetical protein